MSIRSSLFKTVPELDSFVYDGKYLIDAVFYKPCLAHFALDGVQKDRLHLTANLKDVFPRILTTLQALPNANEKMAMTKILVIDFAYYVLQGNVVQPGMVVVQINQQTNDIRAANLALLPGANRKDYRSTDIVPRDGIFIGNGCFLPKTLTILKSPAPGKYQFQLTLPSGKTKKFGFDIAGAASVYSTLVVPVLTEINPNFARDDETYKTLCSSYMSAFPNEATTQAVVLPEITPHVVVQKFYPRGQEQVAIKKKIRDDIAAAAAALPAGTRECKTCVVVLAFEMFEGQRLECMKCRTDRRREKDATKVHDPNTTKHTQACLDCGIAFDPILFQPRGEGFRGVCRKCTNAKKYYEVSREKMRGLDV